MAYRDGWPAKSNFRQQVLLSSSQLILQWKSLAAVKIGAVPQTLPYVKARSHRPAPSLSSAALSLSSNSHFSAAPFTFTLQVWADTFVFFFLLFFLVFSAPPASINVSPCLTLFSSPLCNLILRTEAAFLSQLRQPRTVH